MEEKAKQILQRILYITIATADKEGHPWNSPVYSAYDSEYNFYWLSDKNGKHSQNVRENPNVFLVVYNSTVPEGQGAIGAGVYMQAKAYELTDEEEIRHALKSLYTRKGQAPDKRKPFEFLGEYPRRVYKAVPETFWINSASNVDGNYLDIREEVFLK